MLEKIQLFFATYALHALGAVLTLIIGFWLIGKFTRLTGHLMEKKEWDLSVRNFLNSLLRLGLKILLLVSVASMFGVNVMAFVGVFSALALAIGLALQGHLSNFASGVLILIFKFFKVGDFIQVNGDSGTVKEIYIFHTVLEALDMRLIVVPNGQITNNSIHNYTAQGFRRHDLTVGIGYASDIDRARAIIIEVLEGLPDLEKERGYDIFVKELADSSVNFAVRFVAKNEFFWPAYKLFFERIKKEFDAAGISIPFPQMDVHLQQSDN